MDRGEADLVAVVHNTGLNTGVGAIAAINQWYGRDDLPIGAYKGTWDTNRGSYVDDVVAHSNATIKNYTQVPAALTASVF
jgi:hypothetical protein